MSGSDSADLAGLLSRWRGDLAAWAIPDHITAAVSESPWVLPRQVFARRAEMLAAQPCGPSFEHAWAALDPPGSVIDVGSGAGAACLPLLPRTTSLTAVDADQGMLDLLAERAGGVPTELVNGTWPQVAERVPAADLVTCHHVLFNVPEPEPFIRALTDHARRLVVLENTATHPLTSLNALWLRIHQLRRPDRPTALDLIAIIEAMGLQPRWQRWQRPGGPDYASFDELVDVTRRRLCLPPDRAGEIADALIVEGVDPRRPADLGSSGREVLTIWWPGQAGD